MHILPDLKALEHKYPRELVVIGVHSAKFDNEKDSENIRRAILRYDIEHPVVNDGDMKIWHKLGVNSWPTFVLIDPEGRIVGATSGEGKREGLDDVIGRLVAYHAATGTLDRSPVHLGLEQRKHAPTALKFPGKVLADEKSDRLFIADSNNNRIVIATLAGKLVDVAGTGEIGAKNGSFAAATFHHPQGLALDGSKLYVADTENHLLRILDLHKKTVSTLAGTGRQNMGRGAGGHLRETNLNSPWDLIRVDRTLYIAMAGAHQVWSHGLGTNTLHVLAGNGKEDIIDGPHDSASFAQPSGLATDGKNLFVADSEGSAIRKIPLSPRGPVSTLAGTHNLDYGQSLFEFGDVSGVGPGARFQHPLGLAFSQGKLLVADTYNHKIKIVDPATGGATTWLGSGKRGDNLEPAQFSEPGGLAIAGGNVYIADTNNHAIKVANPETRQVRLLSIEGLAPPARPASRENDDEPEAKKGSAAISVETQHVAAGDALRIEFSFTLPFGYKLNKSAVAVCRLRAKDGAALISPIELAKRREAVLEGDKAVVTVPLAAKTGNVVLEASLTYFYCRDGVGGLCKQATAHWKLPVELSAGSKQRSINLVADATQN